MKAKTAHKILAMILAVGMLVGMFPVSVFAGSVNYTEEADDYYKVVSKKDWELAPGINESEIIINNDSGDRRQVMHVVEVDVHNEYTKVIPSSKGMIPTAGQYGVQTMDKQAAFAEANGYGNVVAAMNISLSWYDSEYYDLHPELVGEPLGYLILDGVQYTNSQGKTVGAQTCLVINFDEKDGVARPSDIPKTQIRSTSDAITGWEEQVIPANFGFLVKDGKMVYSTEEHTSEGASRSMVGIKEDGSIIMVMNDGRQAPYSTGFNNYEMSEAMLKLGCVYAINGDGGGSSQFLSQRPGEEFKVNCSPSDGDLRATTHGILVISTAPSTGEFVRAHVEAENSYYTPNSHVQFKAVGADLVGAAADIPEGAYWQLADSSFGTIDNNGVFVSNGKTGEVTAQLVYNNEIKGSATINIVVPTAIAFGTAQAYTVPFDESVNINVTATYDVFDVTLKASDYTITFSDKSLGTLNGNMFTAGNIKGTADMTVTLNANSEVFKTIPLTVGKGSEVIFDFEENTESANLDNWLIKDHEGKYTPYSDISIVTSEEGMVHNGESSLAIHMPMHQHVEGSEGYNANSITWVGDPVLLENATAIGMWVYVPEEATQTEIALNYVWYNASGVQQRTTPDLCMNDDFNGNEYSGWHYLSVPISKSVAYIEDATQVAASQGYKRNFFLKFYVTNSGNAGDESSYMGDVTYYIDDVTIDYSDAVADRINPVFKTTCVKDIGSDSDIVISAGQAATVKTETVGFTAEVVDNVALDDASARIYVDGSEVPTSYKNGRILSSDTTISAGSHRVVYEIADTAGNISRAVRYIYLAGSDVPVSVVPRNPDATVALTGSVYWIDVVADNAENVDKITLKLDLDTMNAWELANSELAYNFDMEYFYASVSDKDDNIITIILTNKGSDVSGNAVVASLPVRVWSYCGNSSSTNISATDAWTQGFVPAVSVNVEVEVGEVVYKDNTTKTFSAEKIHIDTEAYVHQYKMDKTYFANNTYHVHTVEPVNDVAANCTESGFTGKTYCSVCDSPVDWGTKIPARGHIWSFDTEGKLVCENGGESFNGVYTDGKTYIDGSVVADGWNAEHTSYYIDGVMLTGSHIIGDVMHTFDENGVYLSDYKYNGFYDIDDTVMYFVNNKYVVGCQWIDAVFYNFDKNGLAYDGNVELCGTVCSFEDGVFVKTDGVLLAGICGDDVYYVIYDDGRMVLDGSGSMMDFVSLGASPWWRQEYRFNIKSITIGKDITRLGHRAFIDTYATEVIFEEGSKLTEISTHAFSQMDGITSITLPDGVKVLGVQAFYKCTNLKDVYLPASVTTIISNTFTGSEKVLLHVVDGSPLINTIEKLNINYVTYSYVVDEGKCGDTATWELYSNGLLKISGTGAMADYAAAGAPWYKYRNEITAVEIGKDITTVGKFSFYNCSKLENVIFAEDGALEVIGWGAFGYTGLQEITIPATVTALNDYAFYNNAELETVAFAEGSKLDTIGRYAFWNSNNLKTVFIPDGVAKIEVGAFINTGSVVLSVAENSFAHTYAKNNKLQFATREPLPFVKYYGTCGDTATWELYSNGLLKISGTGAMAEYAAAGAPWYKYRNEITAVEIGKDITTVGKFSFYNCSKLENVIFAEDGALEVIGWGAFGYTGLQEITIPATVKVIDRYAMYYCAELKAVNFAENSKIALLDAYAFLGTSKLESVNGINEDTNVHVNAFYGSAYNNN